MGAALRAADAVRLTSRALACADELRGSAPIRIIAAGKAAPAMAAAAVMALGPRIVSGLVIAPEDTPISPPLELIVGQHPQPGAGSAHAGARALQMACDAGADEQLLVLLSGGASSLMAAPAKGVTLDDKRQTTARLLRAGADIHALNTVRKHLSAIKGGWLAAASPALAVTTLVISDVVDDDLSVIASGPTVADASTFAEALAVLERFGGRQAYPPSVVDRLAAGADGHLPETPKPGDARLTRSTAKVIGSRFDAMRGADAEAAARGYRTVMLTEPVVGEARQVGPAHTARVLAQLMTMARPVCAISSGETTVTVSGSGRGGRNQELALAVAVSDVLSDKTAALASVGTDGVDGPTDAAGAIVDSSTHERARVAGLDAPDLFLAANNSYAFFAGLGDLIHTGPTGTNVGDLQIFLLA